MKEFETWVTLPRAIELLQSLKINRNSIFLPLESIVDKTLATSLIALRDDPNADISAMDGFAVKNKDVKKASKLNKVELTIQEKILAGNLTKIPILKDGHGIRIMTGARIPKEADRILLIENVEIFKNKIITTNSGGNHIRKKGEHHKKGDVILQSGHKITPSTIATIASLGHNKVEILSPLKIAVIPTGDELIEVGKSIKPGQIYESNSWAITLRLRQLGYDANRCKLAPDNKEKLIEYFNELSKEYDIIITSGGVSLGDADYVRSLMIEKGTTLFWRIKMKPGSPPIAGRWHNTPLIGLPGNPVSSMIVLRVLVEPWLSFLDGRSIEQNFFEVQCNEKLPIPKDKILLPRVSLKKINNQLFAIPFPHQGSGHTSVLSKTDAIVWLDPATPSTDSSKVKVLLLNN